MSINATPLIRKFCQVVQSHNFELAKIILHVPHYCLEMSDEFGKQLAVRHNEVHAAYLDGWADCERYYQNKGDNKFYGQWYSANSSGEQICESESQPDQSEEVSG